MCDECTLHHKTFPVQLYWHLAIKLYSIVHCICPIASMFIAPSGNFFFRYIIGRLGVKLVCKCYRKVLIEITKISSIFFHLSLELRRLVPLTNHYLTIYIFVNHFVQCLRRTTIDFVGNTICGDSFTFVGFGKSICRYPPDKERSKSTHNTPRDWTRNRNSQWSHYLFTLPQQ